VPSSEATVTKTIGFFWRMDISRRSRFIIGGFAASIQLSFPRSCNDGSGIHCRSKSGFEKVLSLRPLLAEFALFYFHGLGSMPSKNGFEGQAAVEVSKNLWSWNDAVDEFLL